MYLIFCIVLIVVFITFIICHYRKKKICKKICAMQIKEKECLLNEVIEPFGYCYEPKQDVFSTTVDAWQRSFGYSEFYSKHSHYINIIFDSEPIYFDYDNKTWLIQFWKGQYGINLGCEVGIYYANKIIPPNMHKYTLFKSVSDDDMLPISIKLLYKGLTIGNLSRNHWWLTIFDLGAFSKTSDLSMIITLHFKDKEMQDAFINALALKGYNLNSFCICNKFVEILYNDCSSCKVKGLRKLKYNLNMLTNKILCKVYQQITKPFYTSLDKALYLYFFLPPIFRTLFKHISDNHKHTKQIMSYLSTKD